MERKEINSYKSLAKLMSKLVVRASIVSTITENEILKIKINPTDNYIIVTAIIEEPYYRILYDFKDNKMLTAMSIMLRSLSELTDKIIIS